MEQKREPRNGLHIVNRSLTKAQRPHNGAKIVSSANGRRTTGDHRQKKLMQTQTLHSSRDTDLTYFTKNNLKKIVNRNV